VNPPTLMDALLPAVRRMADGAALDVARRVQREMLAPTRGAASIERVGEGMYLVSATGPGLADREYGNTGVPAEPFVMDAVGRAGGVLS